VVSQPNLGCCIPMCVFLFVIPLISYQSHEAE
jgi:hypothetical protein